MVHRAHSSCAPNTIVFIVLVFKLCPPFSLPPPPHMSALLRWYLIEEPNSHQKWFGMLIDHT
jgi:hypothetical protein